MEDKEILKRIDKLIKIEHSDSTYIDKPECYKSLPDETKKYWFTIDDIINAETNIVKNTDGDEPLVNYFFSMYLRNKYLWKLNSVGLLYYHPDDLSAVIAERILIKLCMEKAEV